MRPILVAIALLLAAVATARAQEAVDYVIPEPFYESGVQYLDLRMVRASGDGVIRAIRNGDVIAEARVHAGANPDVRLRFDFPLRGNAAAVLFVGGEAVAEGRLRLVPEGSPLLRD